MSWPRHSTSTGPVRDLASDLGVQAAERAGPRFAQRAFSIRRSRWARMIRCFDMLGARSSSEHHRPFAWRARVALWSAIGRTLPRGDVRPLIDP